MRARIATFLLQTVIVAVASVLLLEAVVAFSFRNPRLSLLPRHLLQYLHVQFDRHTIQMMPECAIYDEHVTYTLKPGWCRFSNREFSNEYRINSLGLRDDEESMRAPQVVMLGDSITMGWGVEQDETFVSVFEKSTGLRTLNAAVSSYATVRELRMLERIDRSALADVVIQYSNNDRNENELFVKDPQRFKTLTRAEYERTVAVHRDSLAYFPGKYSLNVLVQLRNMLGQRGLGGGQPDGDPGARDRDADIFLRVLELSPVDLTRLRLTVISLDRDFIAAVRARAAKASTPWMSRVSFVDLSGIAAIENAFFVLDEHPTAIGHRAIAAELAKALRHQE